MLVLENSYPLNLSNLVSWVCENGIFQAIIKAAATQTHPPMIKVNFRENLLAKSPNKRFPNGDSPMKQKEYIPIIRPRISLGTLS